jgi:leucyl-tRNA synthetase
VSRELAETLILMLGPLVPHIAEELWKRIGNTNSIVHTRFPEADPKFLLDELAELPVQINGKVRSRIVVASGSHEEALQEAALSDERIAELLRGKEIRKVIVIPDKLVNIVAS